MKRPLSLKARIRAGLPPGPLYRDICPSREAMALYDDDGNIALCVDLPTVMMKRVRRYCRQDELVLPELLIGLLQDKLDGLKRGF